MEFLLYLVAAAALVGVLTGCMALLVAVITEIVEIEDTCRIGFAGVPAHTFLKRANEKHHFHYANIRLESFKFPSSIKINVVYDTKYNQFAVVAKYLKVITLELVTQIESAEQAAEISKMFKDELTQTFNKAKQKRFVSVNV